MLSLASSALSFSAPALAPRLNQAAVSMKAPGEIGVTPPLGVFDPLGCLNEPIEYPRRSYRRYQELENKHGRRYKALLPALPNTLYKAIGSRRASSFSDFHS